MPRPAVEVLECAALAERAAALIVERLRDAIAAHGGAVLVPSAGRTPIPTYRLLCARHAGVLDWRRVHVVQMDEYRGLGMGDPRSLAHCIFGELVRPLRVGGFSHFNDAAGRLTRPLAEYEALAGRIDLVVHGIGRNGHIGFNEPGAAMESGCRIVRLSGSTLRANRMDVREGVTLGLKSLLAARASLLLATGAEKAAALGRALTGPPSDRCPASRLRGCRNVAVLADPLAASRVAVSRGVSERTYREARGEPLGQPSRGVSATQKTSNNRLI